MDQKSRIRLAELQRSFAEQLDAHNKGSRIPNGGSLERGFHLIQSFELMSSYLYQLRRQSTAFDPLLEQTEDYLAHASADFMAHGDAHKQQNRYKRWLQRYRLLWQTHFALFLMTAILFIGTCFIGWILATQYTAYVSVLIPHEFMERIIQKDAWFESLAEAPLLTGAFIAWNNIKVCLTAFSLSAILGLGGMYILCFNGIFFGAVMGFCFLHDFDKPLTQFVLSHGPLELSIIVASAFAGLVYGRVFFMRPYKLFGTRLRTAGREAGVIVTGIVPWLVLAGFIESFISPSQNIPMAFRMAVGSVAALAFWIWTLYPAKTEVLKV